MAIFYSKESNGFYNDAIITVPVPEGAIEISQDLYESLLSGQSQGKVIGPDKDGNPVLNEPPEPTKAQLIERGNIEKARRIAEATVVIGPLQDAEDLSISTDDEKAQLSAWKKYRVLLNRVDTTLAPDIEWPTSPQS
ncbi:tail fiber assembly protein [Pantoea stewartii]|uniref:tail fiber assembly protein n=1 Tax=Pantoea stewartii TaxID=66269 RepID=UPI0023F6475B|nr:tail fiber assembly protein [Pantoea stewartii]MDF7787844.1 tail fiber assembly protein [Pantoea stewartii]